MQHFCKIKIYVWLDFYTDMGTLFVLYAMTSLKMLIEFNVTLCAIS